MKLSQPSDNLMILKDNQWFVFVLGALLAVIGLVGLATGKSLVNGSNNAPWPGALIVAFMGISILLVSEITTIKVDNKSKRITIRRWRIIGRGSHEYDLQRVSKIELRVGGYSFKLPETLFSLKKYSLFFLFADGGRTSFYYPGGRRGAAKAGARIAQFLRVPFEESA